MEDDLSELCLDRACEEEAAAALAADRYGKSSWLYGIKKKLAAFWLQSAMELEKQ